MNETELRTLVEHDRTRHEVGPAPTGSLLRRARTARTRRRSAWAAGAAALAVAASLAVVAALPDSRPTAHPSGPVDPNPNDAFAPPPGTRWTGLGGYVIAVPAGWSTQFAQLCARAVPRTVTYEVPGAEVADCPMRVEDLQRPTSPQVSISSSTNDVRSLRKDWTPVPVGSTEAFLSPIVAFGPCCPFTGTLEIPGRAAFSAEAGSRAAVRHILLSVRELPPDLRLVPREVADPVPADMTDRVRSAGFRTRYAEESSPSWMQNHHPGLFIRTDPPVGTPLPPGSTVTVYANDGPIDLYVGTKPVREHHWSVASPSDFTPRISRTRAVELAGLGEPTSWRTALLRRLTIPGTGVHDRDVWLAVHLRIPNYGPRVSDVTVIDATTGRRLAHDTFLH